MTAAGKAIARLVDFSSNPRSSSTTAICGRGASVAAVFAPDCASTGAVALAPLVAASAATVTGC